MGSNRKAGPTLLAAVVIVAFIIAAGAIVMRITAPAATPGEITLYCDNALRPVVDEIIEAFQRRSDVRVTAYSGTSAEILREFENDPRGADLLMPGDASYLDQAGELITDTTALAWVVPVILVQSGNPSGIETVADLGRPGVEIGVADPNETPLGRKTPEILEHHGLTMEALEANIHYTSENDAELSNAVRLGRIDAAIVWDPIARLCLRCGIVPIPVEEPVVAVVAVGLSSGTHDAQAAREFMAFLRGRAAQAQFEQYHFTGIPME